jgi:hypothetical protein
MKKILFSTLLLSGLLFASNDKVFQEDNIETIILDINFVIEEPAPVFIQEKVVQLDIKEPIVLTPVEKETFAEFKQRMNDGFENFKANN